MRAPSKRVAQYLHSRARARQRYALNLSWDDVDAFVRAIQQRRGVELVERTSRRISVWDVTYQGVRYRVVYDRARANLITFLPRPGDGPAADGHG